MAGSDDGRPAAVPERWAQSASHSGPEAADSGALDAGEHLREGPVTDEDGVGARSALPAVSAGAVRRGDERTPGVAGGGGPTRLGRRDPAAVAAIGALLAASVVGVVWLTGGGTSRLYASLYDVAAVTLVLALALAALALIAGRGAGGGRPRTGVRAGQSPQHMAPQDAALASTVPFRSVSSDEVGSAVSDGDGSASGGPQ